MRSAKSLLVALFTAAALVLGVLPGQLIATADATDQPDLSVPYGSDGWRYKDVSHGSDAGFESPSYDDSSWQTGTAPFGTSGCSGTPAPKTYWPPNTDMLVRRSLDLNPTTLTGDLTLKVAIDNDVDVFFNGTLIASNDYEGCGQEKAIFDIPRALVVDGANTLAVRGIDRGSIDYLDLDLIVPGGQDPVTPPPPPHDLTADAGPDQSVDEGAVVTLDGSGSQTSTKPVLAASDQLGTLPGGTSVGVHLVGVDPDADPAQGLRVTGSVDIGQGPASQNTSVAYVVDVSGSANDIVGCGGDANGDGRIGTVLDCEIAAVAALNQKVVASGSVQKVALISFSSSAGARDLDPTTATATLVAPDADKDGNGVLDVLQAAKALRAGGGTAFAPPARTACQLLATSGSTNLVAAFLSDGGANDTLPTLPCSPPVTFQTFAVGTGSSCTGSAGHGLTGLANGSGGTCHAVPDVTDLPDILPQVIGSQISGVTYTVDDQPPVDISGDLGLPAAGPATRDLAITLPTDLSAGSHRICVSVTGSDSGGQATVTTCSDLTSVSGALSYHWRQVSAGGGPPVFLSNPSSAHPSFVAPDDGTYTFELTVSDGLGGSATDQVVVAVHNRAPTLTLRPGDAYAGGVTQVDGTFTDPGWLDTHHAMVSWGDGTTDQVPVSVQGTGWGSLFGSHVYQTSGTYAVTVTLTDDDGGQVAKTLGGGGLSVGDPVAVWANSTGSRSINWGGAAGNIWGRVHTNGELRFVGTAKTVLGPATYAGTLSADTTKNSFLPAVATAPVQGFPFTYAVSDFRPGASIATQVGPAYHDMTASCSDGTWHSVQAALASGVYYSPCPIQLNGSDIGGRVTLVSESTIKISGSRPSFEPYLDGLLLLAGSSANAAIDISASSSKFLGTLFAGTGEISVSGSGNRFWCGILADRVTITGGDTDIHGTSCRTPANTASSPVVVPDLRSGLTVDRQTALPGQSLGYRLSVTNAGSTLIAPALIGLQNVDTTTETVTDYDFSLERLDTATNTWVPLATKGDGALQLAPRANPYPGVTYGANGAIGGTTVPAGGWATWGMQAVLSLTPAQVTGLLDPATTSGIRLRSDFTVTPSGTQARRLFTYGENFIAALRSQGADVTSATSTFLPPSGDAETIGSDSTPGLARLTPGQTVTVDRSWTLPVPARRAVGETDQAYLARLKALDGSQLTGAAFVLAAGGVGQLVAPLATTTSTRQLPVLKVDTTGPSTVTAGTTNGYQLKLSNVGSSSAGGVTTSADAGGTALMVTGAPAALAAGEVAQASMSYQAHSTPAVGTVPVRGSATWTDAAGNSYGDEGSTVEVTEQLPGALSATLADQLVRDVRGDGATSPGDTVRYTMIVRNTGDAPLSGVHARIGIDAATTLVPGSIVVPAGGSGSSSNGQVDVTLPDILGQTARTVTFDAVVADPFPPGAAQIAAQGTVSATGVSDVLTDDATLPGPADPTVTPVIQTAAALSALLTARLAIDADGDGTVTPGDTLAYDLQVASTASLVVTDVHVQIPVPSGAGLVAGSLRASQGTVTEGSGGADSVVVLGDLGPFQAESVDFRAKVTQPLPSGVTAVSDQATITSPVLVDLLSDDPSTAERGDPTVVPVGVPGMPGSPEQNGPAIGAVTPLDGTVVTAPTTISTTLTPPTGQTLDSWIVDYRRADDTNVTVLATGSGADVSAILDPTVLPNGTYVVTVRATTGTGGLSTQDVTVVVDGAMKLGRYITTLTDMTVGVSGLPIRIQRRYDSFDKSTGDFGVGWNLAVADFQVSSNGPLGDGGWTMAGCGGGLIFSPLCFTSSSPHFVTVTWPDGHNEYFDLTPANGSTFFPGLTSAAFTARKGSSSTLAAVDDSLFFRNGSLLSGAFGSGPAYDPTEFVLTDKAGNKYHLTVGTGLTKIVDLNGNVTTFGHDGITSSTGQSVTFTRDAQDRITKVQSADGHSVRYTYDPAGADGDLVSVTNQLDQTTGYTYLPNHYLDKVTGPDSTVMSRYEYTDGRLSAVIDGNGNRTELTSDPTAQEQAVTSPDGRLTTISKYDDHGRLAERDQVFGGRSLVTTYTHDAVGRITSVEDPQHHVERWTYDESATSANGNLLSYTDASGRTVRFQDYDAHGHAGTLVGADGSTIGTYDYDPATGLLMRSQGAGQAPVVYTYDHGIPKTVTDQAGRVTTYHYNAAGVRTSVSDSQGRTTTYVPDANGHYTSVTDPTGRTTAYTYNAAGDITSVTDPTGVTATYAYNARGLLRQVGDGTSSTTYTYNDAGRVASRTDRNGDVTTYGYDGSGRLATETLPGGHLTSYRYDPLGRLVESDNESGEVTFAYDDSGKVLSQTTCAPQPGHADCTPAGAGATQPTVSVSYTWYADGNEASVTGPDGTTSYRHDTLGRLDQITDPDHGVFAYTYDQTGLDSVSLPNGASTDLAFDPSGLIASRDTTLGSTTLSRADYQRDPVTGQQLSMTDLAGTSSYSYDDRGWLTQATHPGSSGLGTESFTYDAAGNIASTSAVPATQMQYDARGRLTRMGGFSFTYDAEGNLLTRTATATSAVTRYHWDADHRLLQVDRPDGSVSRYGYDPLGRRISAVESGQTRRFVWDAFNLKAAYDGSNNLVTSYVTMPTQAESRDAQQPAEVLEEKSAGATGYFLLDGSGSTIGLSDAAGHVTSSYRYGAFGRPGAGNGLEAGYTWNGAQYDAATGMYYLGNRYYDPSIGRFISQDARSADYFQAPLGRWSHSVAPLHTSDPVSFNPYAYAGNDPIDLADPSGDGAIARLFAGVACAVIIGANASGPLTEGTVWNDLREQIVKCAEELGDDQRERAEYKEGTEELLDAEAEEESTAAFVSDAIEEDLVVIIEESIEVDTVEFFLG